MWGSNSLCSFICFFLLCLIFVSNSMLLKSIIRYLNHHILNIDFMCIMYNYTLNMRMALKKPKHSQLEKNNFLISQTFAGVELCYVISCLITSYRSITYGNPETFKDRFSKFIDLIYFRYKRIVVVGEFNFDLGGSAKIATEFQNAVASYWLTRANANYAKH